MWRTQNSPVSRVHCHLEAFTLIEPYLGKCIIPGGFVRVHRTPKCAAHEYGKLGLGGIISGRLNCKLVAANRFGQTRCLCDFGNGDEFRPAIEQTMTLRWPVFEQRSTDFDWFDHNRGTDAVDRRIGIVDVMPTFGDLLFFVRQIDTIARIGTNFSHPIGRYDNCFVALEVSGQFNRRRPIKLRIEIANQLAPLSTRCDPNAVGEILTIRRISSLSGDLEFVSSRRLSCKLFKLPQVSWNFDMRRQEEIQILTP